MTVEFGGQQLIQFAKRSLIRRVIVTRHAVIFLVARFRGVALPLAFELYVGDLVEEKVRHPRLGNVGILQLDPEPDGLVVAASQIERNLPPLREVEPAGLLLDLAPVGTEIDLLHEGQLDQVLQSLFLGLTRDIERSSVVGKISDESHAVIGDDFPGRRSDHRDIAVGNNRAGTVLRERPLIKPVGNRRPWSPIVFVPVMFRHGGVGAGLEQADCESGCSGGFQEAASIHGLSGKGEVSSATSARYRR